MINRILIQQVLHANGLDESASPEAIREALLQAKWHEADITEALRQWQNPPNTSEPATPEGDAVFNSDARLQPETITALLGIDVKVQVPRELDELRQRGSWRRVREIIGIVVFSTVLAIGCVLAAMWFLQIDLLHAVYPV